MSRVDEEPCITLFVESRAWRTPGGGCVTDDRGLAGRAWEAELRETDRLRLALRVDERGSNSGGERIEGSIVPLPYYVGVLAMVRRLPALLPAIDAAVQRSDIVDVKLPGAIGLIAVARARRHRKPIAVQVMGDIADVLRSGVAGRVGIVLAPTAARAIRWAVRRASAVRYVTERVLQARYPAADDATTVAFSDVRVDLSRGSFRRVVPGRIIAVGSQEQPYKGHQVLIEAFAQLAETHPRSHLVLVGDGRYRPRLQQLAIARGLGDRVRFAGHIGDRDELIALLDSAEVFAMPSLTEGLPRALIEAMARGVPCIGSDVGGIPELLPAEALARAGDPRALADLLQRVLGDTALRERLGAVSRATADRFGPEALESRRREWSAAVRRLALLESARV